MHIRSNTISPQDRARKAGKLFDYFSVSIYETLPELLAHTRINHDNTVRFAREARVLLRKGGRDAHRIHELACEDKAHAHSILARAKVLEGTFINPASDERSYLPPCPTDIAALVEIQNICFKTLAVKIG
jgi:hypothetical protein